MPFPVGNFAPALIKDENMYNVASLNKIILWGKKITATMESRIPMCLPNYTKKRNIRDLLDLSDPKDKMSTIHIQSLRPLRARVQLINIEKSEWSSIMGERIRHQDLPFWESYEGTGPQSYN